MNIRFLNEQGQDVIKSWYMPDGQPYAVINSDESVSKDGDIEIHARIKSFNDVGIFLAGAMAIYQNLEHPRLSLYLYYPFFGRQDRVTKSEGGWEAPETYAMFLDVLLRDIEHSLDHVYVLHPHSEVYIEQIEKYDCEVSVLDHTQYIAEAIREYQPDCLVLPDQGSARFADHYHKLFQTPIVQCSKRRDPVTGKLSNPQIESGSVEGRRCLIVDDICDGAYTFIQLSEVLREKGAGGVGLYTTHGIYSRGYSGFVGKIDALFTTNSYHRAFMRDVEDSTALDRLVAKMFAAFPEGE